MASLVSVCLKQERQRTMALKYKKLLIDRSSRKVDELARTQGVIYQATEIYPPNKVEVAPAPTENTETKALQGAESALLKMEVAAPPVESVVFDFVAPTSPTETITLDTPTPQPITETATLDLPVIAQPQAEHASIEPTFNQPKLAADLAKNKVSSLYSIGIWLMGGLFILFQLNLSRIGLNGPFLDEGIYITSGLRIFQGFGLSDNYLTWFAGSLLWPTLAGIGFKLGGLAGVRMIATLCVAIGIIATGKAAQNLFGERAGFWTALTFGMSGLALNLGHFAVYDVLALVGMSVSFWAITQTARYNNRTWLIIAALAASLGVLAKYPIVLAIVPLGALLIALRGKKSQIDLVMFGFISLSIGMIFFITLREQLSELIPFLLKSNSRYDSLPMTGWSTYIYLGFAPALLAIAGWVAAKGQRKLAWVLLIALFIWPVYRLIFNNPLSHTKQLIFGYLFCYPLIGLVFARLWRAWVGRIIVSLSVVALAGLGYVQMSQLDQGWADVRPAAYYLAENVQPKDQLLINSSWSFLPYLYGENHLDSPWNVFDTYRIQNGENSTKLCDFDWWVEEEGSQSWPAPIQAELKACSGFEKAFTSTAQTVYMKADLTFATQYTQVTVWHNSTRREVK